MVHKMRTAVWLERIEHGEQPLRRQRGVQRVIAHKRLTQGRAHRARLQGGHHGKRTLTAVKALAGYLPPWAAGLGMAGSSLFVVLNALRLRRFSTGESP